MKKSIIIIGLISFLILSFTSIESGDKNKFVGSWKGSEKDNQTEGTTKYWIQNRYKDGTFVLIFTTVNNCEVEHLAEKGKWWIKDGIFYELHNDGKTDTYTYEILDDNQIKFKAKNLSLDFENSTYEFIDTRVEFESENK